MKASNKMQLKKSIVSIAAALFISSGFSSAMAEDSSDSKPAKKIHKEDVVCPEDDVAMMGGMGMGTTTMGTGGVGMGTGGTQGTMGGMGGGMGTGTQGGMGGMGAMGAATASSDSDDDTLAPKGALSHSPCSKEDTNDKTQ